MVTEPEGSRKPTQKPNATFVKYLLTSLYLDFVHRVKFLRLLKSRRFGIWFCFRLQVRRTSDSALHTIIKPCSAELDKDLVPNES